MLKRETRDTQITLTGPETSGLFEADQGEELQLIHASFSTSTDAEQLSVPMPGKPLGIFQGKVLAVAEPARIAFQDMG